MTGDFYKNVPNGYLSLYEYNLDRTGKFIYPFVVKQGHRVRFRNETKNLTGERKSATDTWGSLAAGDEIASSYKMSASITRQYLEPDISTQTGMNHTSSVLKNMCIQYQTINPSFKTSELTKMFTGSVNMINVPSIFYGSEIKKGSIELNYYITGTLIATAKDDRQNGQLYGTYGTTSGSVIGHVLYREGILFFPSSSTATGHTALDSGNSVIYNQLVSSDAKWIYFGGGANDSFTHNITHAFCKLFN